MKRMLSCLLAVVLLLGCVPAVAETAPATVIDFADGNHAFFGVDSAAGWKRIQSQSADTDGKTAQITFEEIAEVLGEDVSAWGARMQCESSGAWSVYSVTVGRAH